MPRTTVANWLFESNEGAGVRVLNIFDKILDRPAFPSELQQYSAELQQGLHDETLIDLADGVCRASFGGEALSVAAQVAYAEAGEPFRYVPERSTRSR